MSNVNPDIPVEPSKLFDYPLIIPTEKWVRLYIDGLKIADSTKPLLLIDASPYSKTGRAIIYFFDVASVETKYLTDSDYTGKQGMFRYWNIKISSNKEIENAAFTFNDTVNGEYRKLIGYIGFKWKAISRITEEDEDIFGHPRNPFHRIDTRKTSRQIQFKIDDEVIAETTKSIALFETGIRVRYYIPMEDINMELLEKSSTTSICPYKGTASYWSVKLDDHIYKDVAWSYLNPLQDANSIERYICFWNIALYVDGVYKGKY